MLQFFTIIWRDRSHSWRPSENRFLPSYWSHFFLAFVVTWKQFFFSFGRILYANQKTRRKRYFVTRTIFFLSGEEKKNRKRKSTEIKAATDKKIVDNWKLFCVINKNKKFVNSQESQKKDHHHHRRLRSDCWRKRKKKIALS